MVFQTKPSAETDFSIMSNPIPLILSPPSNLDLFFTRKHLLSLCLFGSVIVHSEATHSSPPQTLYMGMVLQCSPSYFKSPVILSLSLSLPYKQPSSLSRICVIRNSVIEGQSLEREGRKKKGLRIIMI